MRARLALLSCARRGRNLARSRRKPPRLTPECPDVRALRAAMHRVVRSAPFGQLCWTFHVARTSGPPVVQTFPAVIAGASVLEMLKRPRRASRRRQLPSAPKTKHRRRRTCGSPHEMCHSGQGSKASPRGKPLKMRRICENRSGAYIEVGEQRKRSNSKQFQGIAASPSSKLRPDQTLPCGSTVATRWQAARRTAAPSCAEREKRFRRNSMLSSQLLRDTSGYCALNSSRASQAA